MAKDGKSKEITQKGTDGTIQKGANPLPDKVQTEPPRENITSNIQIRDGKPTRVYFENGKEFKTEKC